METITETTAEAPIVKNKRKYVRVKPLEPKPPSSRLDLVTGKYNNNPLDPNYFKTYFQEKLKGVKVECPHCHKFRNKSKIAGHMKSSICFKNRSAPEMDENTISKSDF